MMLLLMSACCDDIILREVDGDPMLRCRVATITALRR